MTQPGSLNRGMPPSASDLARQLTDLRREVQELRNQQRTAALASRGTGDEFFVPATHQNEVATASVIVPDGFSRCAYSAQGRVYTPNTTGDDDALYPQFTVGGQAAVTFPWRAPPGKLVTATTNLYGTLSGLTDGQVVTASLSVSSLHAAWSTDPSQGAAVEALFIFYR